MSLYEHTNDILKIAYNNKHEYTNVSCRKSEFKIRRSMFIAWCIISWEHFSWI